MVTAAPPPPLSKITNLQDYSSQFFRSSVSAGPAHPAAPKHRVPAPPRSPAPPPLAPPRGGTCSVGGAGPGSRAVIGGVRATAATLCPTGRPRVTEKQNGWNPFAPSSDTSPAGVALYQPRCIPRLSSRAERPPKQGKVAADRNRLVFHLTGCLVSADCCPLTSEPLRRPGCQQAADGSLGIPQFTSWTGPRLGESSATYPESLN